MASKYLFQFLLYTDSDGARSTGLSAVFRNPLRVLAVILILLAVEGLVVTGLTHLQILQIL